MNGTEFEGIVTAEYRLAAFFQTNLSYAVIFGLTFSWGNPTPLDRA